MKTLIKSALASAGFEIRKIRHTPQVKAEGCVVEWPYRGQPIRFYMENRHDLIGKDLFNGSFFETEELEELGRRVDPSGTVVDIGANIGNHTVYFGAVLKAARVIAFEPGSWASAILAYNVALNDLGDRVTIHKLALSDHDGTGRMSFWAEGNHGTLSLSDDPGGETVRIARGDSMLADVRVSLLKIDAERHERQVLAGLEQTIARDRPVIAVEVAQTERADMADYLAGFGYRTVFAKERYGDIVNLVLEATG